MGNSIKLTDLWENTSPKERAEFMAGLCKCYASLICAIIKEQGSCPVSKYLFGEKGGEENASSEKERNKE